MTCLKWLPGSPNLFLAGHSSGHLYLYNEELPCAPTAPHYSAHRLGDGFSVHTVKSKVARNPVQRWTFGGTDTTGGSINEFAFSPCGLNLAIASQDGFLRVFRYESMELLGIARSYFGGFLCVCWSPDGKYIVVGGEDDLVTVWSLSERRVVARGQGHRSWVSVVAFDPYTTSCANSMELGEEDPDVSDDDGVGALYRSGRSSTDQLNNNSGSGGAAKKLHNGGVPSNSQRGLNGAGRRRNSSLRHSVSGSTTSYRLGSVSQDTQLCLWDITEDVLRPPVKPSVLSLRNSVTSPQQQQPQQQPPASGTRIEVKPAVEDKAASVVGGSTSVQTPASSLSSSISSSNNNTHAVAIDKVDGGEANAKSSTTGGTMSSNSKQKPNTTISLIGNCVGNNLHKMTTSSSISSTSSVASMNTAEEAPGVAGPSGSNAKEAIGNGAKHSSDSSSASTAGLMTLNAFTQRLSNFSLRHGDGGGTGGGHSNQGKRGFTLSKPFGGHNSISSE